jgi:hypothetical protein
MINLATFWIYVTHDSQLCIKSKKFTGIFNKKKIHAWWESTKWISWKEFAQTGREKV